MIMIMIMFFNVDDHTRTFFMPGLFAFRYLFIYLYIRVGKSSAFACVNLVILLLSKKKKKKRSHCVINAEKHAYIELCD